MYCEQSPGRSGVETGDIHPLVDLIGIDVDEFVDRMAGDAVGGRRRLGGAPGRVPIRVRSRSNDGDAEKPPKIELVLYTSPSSEKSQRAARAIHEILKRYDASQVKFTTCDLSTNPQDGDTDGVLFTPTLVKQGPGPRTSIIGNLEQEDILCDLLDASGVDRRRWDD